MEKVVVLINKLSEHPNADERDVLDQAAEVEQSLHELGFSSERVFMDLNLAQAHDELLMHAPKLVFNLVEGLEGKANLIHLAPALLESMGIPYTGCRHESMFVTSNKTLAKKILQMNNVVTAAWFSAKEVDRMDAAKTYIAKPLWEDASVGITDTSVFRGDDKVRSNSFKEQWKGAFFVEEFIEGREFNLSVMMGENRPQVLPPAEIIFKDFPNNKPKIVGYAAKWDEAAFEYSHTVRSFSCNDTDKELVTTLSEIASRCWTIFGLRGYARVDFRVDREGIPYVLEINANPCLASNAGFYAACSQAHLMFTEVVKYIVRDALR